MRDQHFLVLYTKFYFLILCKKTSTKSCTNELSSPYKTHLSKLGYKFSDNHGSYAPNNFDVAEVQYLISWSREIFLVPSVASYVCYRK